MRRTLLPLIACVALAGCGARTGLAVGDGGTAGPCTEEPWILFSYIAYPTLAVYAMHADGSALRALSLPSRPLDPWVSADGLHLVYVDVPIDAGDDGLVVVDLATGARHTLLRGAELSYPVLSPDGALVSFAEGLDLHIARRDGSGDRVLIRGPYEIGCCGWGYGHPTFESPSSLFWTTAGLVGTIRADGTAQTTLLTSDFVTLPYPNPALSPDGTEVASVIACARGNTELRIYRRASLPAPCASGTVVVSGLSPDSAATNSPNPAWGPTGLVAFGQGNDVFVVDAHGGVPRNLTSALTAAGGAAGNPTWAPGCTRLP